ncbi:neutral and basic amino acid transport protein rBAT-like isoform X2 [Salarias fasciatus]|nr:neutral and basic amino acid transport protein rBAT-like isoform X2 [Salarias fasciatus]
MGAFLDKPKTEKHNSHGEGNGLRYGLSSMQGWRVEMEDAHTAVLGLPAPGMTDWSFFAVYDGHAGSKVANYCSKHLLEHIITASVTAGGTQGFQAGSDGSTTDLPASGCPAVEAVKAGIRTGFLRIDEHMRSFSDLRNGMDRSGSTAVGILLSPDHFFFINCGDSRAVLYRNSNVCFSTLDHKPCNPRERERIQNAGGSVMIQRVNGSLAVSRALGDYDYKCVDGKGPTEQLVSPEPEVFVMVRAPEQDQFVILACDGIWDVMSNEELCEFVKSRLEVCDDLERVCNEVVDTCLHKGSRDNMSVVLVCLPNAPQVSEEAVRKEAELNKYLETRVEEMLSRPGDEGFPDLVTVMRNLSTDSGMPTLPPGGGLASKRSVIEAVYNRLNPYKEEDGNSLTVALNPPLSVFFPGPHYFGSSRAAMSLGKSSGASVEMGECTRNPSYREADSDGPAAAAAAGRSSPEPAAKRLSSDAGQEYLQIQPYAGMPKEVLLRYSSQARYRVTREVLFWLTVACTLALVGITIAVIALSPGCLGWWQGSPVYQVYPRSFKDSDGDGIGDLRGIRQQLDHFLYLNIKSVWISPFYRSPMKDFGYDVEDFREIDPIFGTMHDFEELLADMHNKGLKLIMDFIPNHTSDRHRWFNLSRTRDPYYENFYVWTNCNATHPKPNNWVSIFGNSSWTYDEVRGQCYLHQFLKEQPDLNFRNPDVMKEMIDIVKFWLDKGVDGFRMDAVKHILEAEHLRDEPQVDPNKPPELVTTEWDLHSDYTTSQVGLHDLLRTFRAEIDNYSREPGRYRFMVTESYDYDEVWKTMMYYSTSLVRESDFPFNFYLLDLPHNKSGLWAKELVNLWMSNMPKGKWPNWVVGNHDRPRISTSAGPDKVRVINMLLLTLPGTATTYYGEEIGMQNINITDSQIQDPAGKYNSSLSRDPERSPMQWNDDVNAGFSSGANSTWLPVHPNYRTLNVEAQMQDDTSVLAQYRFLNRLRSSELPLNRGWFCYVHADAQVFSYLREFDGLQRAYLMVMNFGEKSAVTDLSSFPEFPERLKVLISTSHQNSGREFPKSQILTEPGEGLMIRYSTDTRFNPNHQGECYISEKACYLEFIDILYKC